ncbi:ABC transporter ATP-binding protein/permease [Haploplasma axanthum]|uniref:ABC transporter ATP-binding protein n=1 Tax=Haploplasma axanthum TaxID=29552 RepID=A0A449BBY3_HAPAX|nr:ABC transporter ATP-binding protein/permease [Haploplasma axanthum]VEU79820.1 ABC transporter ATP-binding protein [Haploplasma axanthum]
MLKLEKVTKKYIDSDKKEVLAVNNVTYKYKDKGLVLIKGKSGSGKTTLLNLISSNDYPTSGSVYFNDLEISNKKEKLINQYKKQIIGYVFQDHNLLEDYTVYENIEFALSIQGKSINEDEVIEYLEKVELKEEYLDKYPDELSGGEQQRVAILRALMKDSKIILADEPTSALDSETKSEIYKILKEISKDKLVILSSHDYENIEEYADVVLKMENGILTEEFNNNKVMKETNSNELEEVKTKINFKYFFKNLKNIVFSRISRYIILLIILIISLTLIGTMISLVSLERYKPIEELFKAGKIEQINFENIPYNDIEVEKIKLEEMSNIFPNIKFHKYYKDYNSGIDYYKWLNNNYYYSSFAGMVKISSENLEKLGLELLIGELPKKNDGNKIEVVISKHIFNYYKDNGYDGKYVDDDEVISSYADLIGKAVSRIEIDGEYYDLVVSGIVDTGSNNDDFEYAKKLPRNISNYNIYKFNTSHRDMFLYVNESFTFDENNYEIYTLTKDLTTNQLISIVDYIYENNQKYNYYAPHIDRIEARIFLAKDNILVLWSVIILFTLITILLFINQVKHTFNVNYQTIGTIKSLGVKSEYFYSLYGFGFLIISFIGLILSTISVRTMINILNNEFNKGQEIVFKVHFYNLYVVFVPIIWIILISYVSIYLPLNKKLKENTKTIMYERI